MIEEEKVTEEHLKIAEANGIPRKVVRQRFNMGWEIDKAISQPVRDKDKDIIPKEAYDLGVKNDIPRDRVYLRHIKLKWTLEDACTIPIWGKKDKVGSSMSEETKKFMEIASAHGISYNTFKSRVLNYGWSKDKAATYPVDVRKRKRKKV